MPEKNDPVSRQARDNETAMRADQRFDYCQRDYLTRVCDVVADWLEERFR